MCLVGQALEGAAVGRGGVSGDLDDLPTSALTCAWDLQPSPQLPQCPLTFK